MDLKTSQFEIIVFNKNHAQKITNFQLKMAKQTQNLDLISQIVLNAVSYLSDHHELGFYLVKIFQQTPIGSLLLTFQNPQSWWVQSVYVQKDYRRQGHFKSLFHAACKVAKQRGSHSLKLYAESQNEQAKQTYRSLGMHMNGQKFYTYDFVYGKTKLADFKIKLENNFKIKKSENGQMISFDNLKDILCKQKLSKNKFIKIYRQEQLIGVAYYFTQFSQWRFGLAYYIDSLFLHKQLSNEDINNIHVTFCQYFSSQTQINLGALRYIFPKNKQSITLTLNGGQVQHYDVMQIDF